MNPWLTESRKAGQCSPIRQTFTVYIQSGTGHGIPLHSIPLLYALQNTVSLFPTGLLLSPVLARLATIKDRTVSYRDSVQPGPNTLPPVNWFRSLIVFFLSGAPWRVHAAVVLYWLRYLPIVVCDRWTKNTVEP